MNTTASNHDQPAADHTPGNGPMTYRVLRTTKPVTTDARWDKPIWQETHAIELGNCMGQYPAFFPRTQVKLRYDDNSIYVIFQVEDRYVLAAAGREQGQVCRDSCVEFFFTPDDNDSRRDYFNVETNCGGAMLFNYQSTPEENVTAVKAEHGKRIDIRSSLPSIVDPEIIDDIVWTVEYRLDVNILAEYCQMRRCEPGVSWRANFYKCGSDTSNQHYLSWARLGDGIASFHVPEFFGKIAFS